MSVAESDSRKRLDQFVDAAFGFAVTLLVIAGGQPPETLDELRTALLNLPASASAFVLIALFWLSHRTFSRVTPQGDQVTLLLSLAIVFTVLAYVYPLRLLSKSAFYFVSGGYFPGQELINSYADLAALYQIYGLGFAVLSGLYAVLFAYIVKFTTSAAVREEIIAWRDPWIICALSGVLSATVAAGPIHVAPWLPPMTYWLIPLAIWARAFWRQRAGKTATKPAPAAKRPRRGGSAPSRRR